MKKIKTSTFVVFHGNKSITTRAVEIKIAQELLDNCIVAKEELEGLQILCAPFNPNLISQEVINGLADAIEKAEE